MIFYCVLKLHFSFINYNYFCFLSTGDVIEPSSPNVIVLSYDKYCRIRALMKRLEGVEEEFMKTKIVVALGGFLVPSKRTKLLFCRDVFEYPELEGHELLCNHLGKTKNLTEMCRGLRA